MMNHTVRFLDAISGYQAFKACVETVKAESKAVLDELTLTEKVLLRYPLPLADKALEARRLQTHLKVRKQLVPVTVPLTASMVEFWRQCAIFGAGLVPGGFDTDEVKALLEGLEAGKAIAADSVKAELDRLEGQLAALNGYDA